MNQYSGAQAKYDEAWKAARDRARRLGDAQPVMFLLGGSPADV